MLHNNVARHPRCVGAPAWVVTMRVTCVVISLSCSDRTAADEWNQVPLQYLSKKCYAVRTHVKTSTQVALYTVLPLQESNTPDDAAYSRICNLHKKWFQENTCIYLDCLLTHLQSITMISDSDSLKKKLNYTLTPIAADISNIYN